MADAWHVKHLIDRAHALGADRAAPLPAASVVVDERVRLKCRVPRCSSYGRNLMCPPHVPGPGRDARRAGALLGRPARAAGHPRHAGAGRRRRSTARPTPRAGRARDAGRGGPAGDERRVTAAQNAFAKLMSALETRGLQARLPLRRRLRRRRLRALRGLRGRRRRRLPAPVRGASVGRGGRRRRRSPRRGRPASTSRCRPSTAPPGPACC